jgi:hypothetical protein
MKIDGVLLRTLHSQQRIIDEAVHENAERGSHAGQVERGQTFPRSRVVERALDDERQQSHKQRQ